jgi:hypothetical protein
MDFQQWYCVQNMVNIFMATTPRQEIINDVKLLLGGSMVDVELNPEDYEIAIKMAFDRYRQRAGNAMEEAYMFLRVLYETNVYTLPDEIVQVRQIFRRGLGETGGGTSLDPFSLAYTNLYLLQAGAGGGYTAGLLTYELFNEYLKQAGRMFGAYLNFTFDPVTKKLQLIRKPTGGEEVLLWVMKVKSDDQLLQDPYIRPWIRNYTLAWAKQLLGEAYSKFPNIPGPQGGTQLKGEPLKAESKDMRDQLEKEIDLYIDSSMPPGIVIG